MSEKTLPDVVKDINNAFEEFKTANDVRLAEIEKKGAADPVLIEKVEKLSGALDGLEELKSRLETAETALARKAKFAGPGADGEDLDVKAARFAAFCAKRRGVPVQADFTNEEMKAYDTAFVEMMRKGDVIIPDHQKALSVGSDPDGGYLVTPDTSGRIVKKVHETSPMRQFASVQTIGTDALEGTHDLEEAEAGWVGETQPRPKTGTPQVHKWRIPVHELYANPKATQKLLDDSEVNVQQWLADKVATKFNRKENAAFVIGDGIGKPRGFLTYPAGTTLPGQIERHKTGVNGAFAAKPDGGDVLLDALYSVKEEYRNGGRWAMPRSAAGATRKLKDDKGNYLWIPGLAAGQSAQLLGYPVSNFEDMPAIGAGSLSIAFANFAEAYQIVDRAGIRVLRDPYTDKPYVHFYTVKRVGGDVLNFEAIKLIEFSA